MITDNESLGNLQNSEQINSLLQKQNCTIDQLLNCDGILSQFTNLNENLLKFLKYEHIQTLVSYITELPPENCSKARAYKFPLLSCEILQMMDIDEISDFFFITEKEEESYIQEDSNLFEASSISEKKITPNKCEQTKTSNIPKKTLSKEEFDLQASIELKDEMQQKLEKESFRFGSSYYCSKLDDEEELEQDIESDIIEEEIQEVGEDKSIFDSQQSPLREKTIRLIKKDLKQPSQLVQKLFNFLEQKTIDQNSGEYQPINEVLAGYFQKVILALFFKFDKYVEQIVIQIIKSQKLFDHLVFQFDLAKFFGSNTAYTDSTQFQQITGQKSIFQKGFLGHLTKISNYIYSYMSSRKDLSYHLLNEDWTYFNEIFLKQAEERNSREFGKANTEINSKQKSNAELQNKEIVKRLEDNETSMIINQESFLFFKEHKPKPKENFFQDLDINNTVNFISHSHQDDDMFNLKNMDIQNEKNNIQIEKNQNNNSLQKDFEFPNYEDLQDQKKRFDSFHDSMQFEYMDNDILQRDHHDQNELNQDNFIIDNSQKIITQSNNINFQQQEDQNQIIQEDIEQEENYLNNDDGFDHQQQIIQPKNNRNEMYIEQNNNTNEYLNQYYN